jgi:hypothetical protein
LGKKEEPISKITREKRAGGVAQGEEYPCFASVSSTPVLPKKDFIKNCLGAMAI